MRAATQSAAARTDGNNSPTTEERPASARPRSREAGTHYPVAKAQLSLADNGSVRRDLQVTEIEARDLLERRCRDDAAEDRAARLVDGDEHDEPGTRRGTAADERRNVFAGGVPAVGVGFLRRARLAGDLIARDRGIRPGSFRDDVLQHAHHLGG